MDSTSATETRNDQEGALGSERAATPQRCGHNGLAMIHQVVGGYVARCLACQRIGPVLDTSEASRRALLELEIRDEVFVPNTNPR